MVVTHDDWQKVREARDGAAAAAAESLLQHERALNLGHKIPAAKYMLDALQAAHGYRAACDLMTDIDRQLTERKC